MRGSYCLLQTGQNEFEHGKASNPGYFMLVTAEQDTSNFVRLGCHCHVHHSADDKPRLGRTITIKEADINKRPVLATHGYMQHAWIGWKEDHALRYLTYVVPEAADFKDAIRI